MWTVWVHTTVNLLQWTAEWTEGAWATEIGQSKSTDSSAVRWLIDDPGESLQISNSSKPLE